MKKTKIICTIGPSSESPDVLEELVTAGMDVARLNFSHGSHDEKRENFKKIRDVSAKLTKPIALLSDIQGPKLRLGEIEGRIEIRTGDSVTLSSEPHATDLPMQFDLSSMIQTGHRIFLNDGLVELMVEKIEGKRIFTSAKNEGWVTSHKGVNIPDTHFNQDIFTQKDREDVKFAIENKTEYVAVSFIQRAEEVERIKNFIKDHNGKAKVCVKIEKKEAVDNLEQIIEAADVIMIARGDLAIETSAAQVPVIQQKIIRLCREQQKPVVVATQMLESMIENPRPTRAEASDVGHAVMSQVDAVMLSAESAVGRYPVQTVKVMTNIINSVENAPEFKRHIKVAWDHIHPTLLRANAITASAEYLSYLMKLPLIAVASATGSTAFHMASFRPSARIVAVTHDEYVQNQLNLVWGLLPIVVDPKPTTEEFWQEISKAIISNEYGRKGDSAAVIGGSIVGVSGVTDTIKVVEL